MFPHPLTNFEIQTYYQNEPKFNGVYSRTNLSKIKDGTCIINLDEYESIECLDSLGAKHISKKIRNFIGNKNITNVYRMQAYDSIMCGYFYIGFIDFMLKVKSLLEYKVNFLLMNIKRMAKKN